MTARTSETPAAWAFEEHEHHDLERGLNRIHDVASEVGHRPTPELSVDILSVLGWLEHTLEPHIAWEEAWLYPEIDARTGTPWATRASRFDHHQIRQTAERLRLDQATLGARAPGDHEAETRCHLYSLEALVRAHIEREERFLIPLLNADASVESVSASLR
ncbi:MAG: hemerythrin domain-containing protein [Candidatus Limnocylindrales bacterium]